jgi:hypothetical protein
MPFSPWLIGHRTILSFKGEVSYENQNLPHPSTGNSSSNTTLLSSMNVMRQSTESDCPLKRDNLQAPIKSFIRVLSQQFRFLDPKKFPESTQPPNLLLDGKKIAPTENRAANPSSQVTAQPKTPCSESFTEVIQHFSGHSFSSSIAAHSRGARHTSHPPGNGDRPGGEACGWRILSKTDSSGDSLPTICKMARRKVTVIASL